MLSDPPTSAMTADDCYNNQNRPYKDWKTRTRTEWLYHTQREDMMEEASNKSPRGWTWARAVSTSHLGWQLPAQVPFPCSSAFLSFSLLKHFPSFSSFEKKSSFALSPSLLCEFSHSWRQEATLGGLPNLVVPPSTNITIINMFMIPVKKVDNMNKEKMTLSIYVSYRK